MLGPLVDTQASMRRIALLAVAGCALATSRADAENFGAAVETGSWFDAETWVTASGTSGVPQGSDDVFIGVPGFPDATAVSGASVTLSGNAAVAGVNIGSYQAASGTGTLVLASGVLTADSLTLDGSSGGAAVLDFAGGSASVSGEFSVVGTAATLTRTSGSFSAASLALNGASLTTTPGDAISTNVTLTNGASLTLGAALSLAGELSVTGATLDLQDLAVSANGTLTLADGSVVNRGAGGLGLLAAGGFMISGATTFTAESGDALTGAGSVTGGATVTTNTPLSGITALSVANAGSTLVANAPIAGLGSSAATVSDAAALTVNAGLTTGTLSVMSATLELNGGALEATHLVFGAPGSAATILRAGGSMDVGSGEIDGDSVVPLLAGDAFDALRVISGVATVTQAAGEETGLWIQSSSASALALETLGGLALNFDVGSPTSPLDWVLRWDGNQVTTLNALLGDGSITVNRPDYEVLYDSGLNATFVAVPEPSALVLLSAAGPAAWWGLNRRRRVIRTTPT